MYEAIYGLTGRPFQLTPDPAFYFESRTHRKAMAYLGYGLAQGEGFIVITGDIGAGKTTLAGHLVATIDTARLHAIQLVSTQVDGDDVLRLVGHGLGLATEGVAKAQLLARTEQALRDVARTGRRTLLIVDEAQSLTTSALEELRMLSNFMAGGQSLIQIFLLGQPEFRDTLKGEGLEQVRQRVIATHHLDPMSADEVGPYVAHRLALVGWQGKPDFTDDAIAALHRHSDGVPRRLNQLGARVLMAAAMEERETIDAALVDTIAADMAEDHGAPDRAPERSSFAFSVGEVADAPVVDPALAARVAELEARLVEQDAALRRVLTLLIDWVEGDALTPDLPAGVQRGNAA